MKIFRSITLAALVLSLGAQVAIGEKLLLMRTSALAKEKQVAEAKRSLETAGHEVISAPGTLEDTALMLGCDADQASCLDDILSTGDADALVLVSDEKIVVRHKKKNHEFALSEGSEASAKLAEVFSPSDAATDSDADTNPEPDGPANTKDSEPVDSKGEETDDEPELTPPVVDTDEPSSTPMVIEEERHQGFSLGKVSTRTWLVLGSGVVVTGLGLSLLAVASSKQGEVDSHPTATAADLDALRRLEDSGASYNAAGNLITILGGATVLAGIGLAVWDAKKAPKQDVAIVPVVDSQSVGVSASWSLR